MFPGDYVAAGGWQVQKGLSGIASRLCVAQLAIHRIRRLSSGHSGARAISAFTRVFDALWRANPESRAARAEPTALDSGSGANAPSRNDRSKSRRTPAWTQRLPESLRPHPVGDEDAIMQWWCATYASAASSSPSPSSRSAASTVSAIRPELPRIAASILPAISGLAFRNALAFSRPWPMRWLS
jgi:hypothetical protein